MVFSGLMACCIVSYLGGDGVRHTVEVQAESLFQAVVLALKTFREHNCAPSDTQNLLVEIRSSVTHTVTLARVRQWVNGGARSPKEAVIKQQLKELL
jgi:hypothetical protein